MCCCVAADSRRQRSIPRIFFFIPHYLANHSSAFICASHFTYQWTGQGDNVEVRIFRLMDWCCDCAFHSSTRENFVDGREKVCAPVGISTLVLVGICVCWREKSSRRILVVHVVIMLLLRGAGDVSQCLASFILFPRRVDEQTRKKGKGPLFFQLAMQKLMMINKRPCHTCMLQCVRYRHM